MPMMKFWCRDNLLKRRELKLKVAVNEYRLQCQDRQVYVYSFGRKAKKYHGYQADAPGQQYVQDVQP